MSSLKARELTIFVEKVLRLNLDTFVMISMLLLILSKSMGWVLASC